MNNKFESNSPEASDFRLVFDAMGTDLYFSLAAYPRDSEYWVLNGDCSPALRRSRR